MRRWRSFGYYPAFLLACMLAVPHGIQAGEEKRLPDDIIRDYLSMPHPEAGESDDTHQDRWQVLVKLAATPEASVEAVERILPDVNPPQRYELVTLLGDHIHTQSSARILCGLLDDPDERIRRSVVMGLRRMAARLDRTGPERRIVSDRQNGTRWIEPLEESDIELYEHEPKVQGLVPFLVKAAGDPSEDVRIAALYALADTREPEAVAALRVRLDDSSDRVRFHAAAFLTEYRDASGLPELKKALARLSNADPANDFRYYSDVALTIGSFERITGKSFGTIPLNPMLLSSHETMQASVDQYHRLIRAWINWWQWTPDAIEMKD